MRRWIERLSLRKIFGLFFLIGALMYGASLNHPFMIDDHTLFDDTMHDIRNLPYQFLPDKAKKLGISDGPGDVYYRPLALAVPMLSRVMFGPLVFGYHAVNLLLYVLAAWVLFIFVRRFFKDTFLAFLTATIFLVHPINGLLVNYITASVFSVQVNCMLMSLWFLYKRESVLQTGASIVFFILSVMCHEAAMALPLYGFIFLVVGCGLSFKSAFRKMVPFFIMLVLYLWWRMDHLSLRVNILDKYAQFHMTVVQWLGTVVKLTAWYLRQLLIHDGIVVIWLTPVVKSSAFVWLLGGILFLGTMGWLFWRAATASAMRLGIVWFVLGFAILPFASLYHMPQMMIEPHWFIFSVLGFFLCLAYAIIWLLKSIRPLIVYGVLAFVALTWVVSVQSYNRLWSTELGYCQWWLSQVPQFKPIHATVARAYFAKGKLREARKHYNQVIFGSHSDFLIYTNIGTIDLLEGKVEDAKVHLKKAISIEKNAQTALNTLGVIAIKEHNYKTARYYFERAAKANPYASAPKQNLARLEKIERAGGKQKEPPSINFRVPY